jgi:hypothetical protein
LTFIVETVIPLLRARVAGDIVDAIAKVGARRFSKRYPALGRAVVHVHLTSGTLPDVIVYPTLKDPNADACGAYITGNKEIIISKALVDALEKSRTTANALRLAAEVFVVLIHELAHYLNHFYGYGEELEDEVKKLWGEDLGARLTRHLWDYRGCIAKELDEMGVSW